MPVELKDSGVILLTQLPPYQGVSARNMVLHSTDDLMDSVNLAMRLNIMLLDAAISLSFAP